MAKSKFLRFFNLHSGEDKKENVLENVVNNISFRGANLWILACAIVIASVGLNVNSTAVIIGAMLISPLMSPIVGAGFALGVYDFPLLKKSLKNLLIATFVSLLVSFLYFTLSPFKDAQSELLARTSPNIYDVLIAFFGGLVGVIAITRVEKGNPIPGVAIATALMPPLCTAGYGLAIGNFSYFAGALYLYTINCFFICLSTFIIVKYLNYPKVNFVDSNREKKITRVITLIILVLIIPSVYFAYTLLQQKQFAQKVSNFIQNSFTDKGYTVVFERTNYNTNPKKLELAFLIKKFSKEEVEGLKEQLKDYGITNTELIIRQDNNDLKADILNEINKKEQNLSDKDLRIKQLNAELNKYQINTPNLQQNIQVLFPQIMSYSIGIQNKIISQDSVNNTISLIYQADKKLSPEESLKLENWMKIQFPEREVTIIENN
ncbi:DUF389 domain-containing protein [Sphingobacterium faecium]|uniref:DUF389 domain-containing protein n=1 Tax=Sphingobacterium faecium TaxID=34087 RepID=UPI00246914D0|nr:DUF389 domain-containing protein [Sphingobacterium faecium]MDH5825595.1 DUF389 domain-containing protein [Sphingobacterium faecium]